MTKPIDEMLEEVLEKLNVVMAYTYVNEKDTLMDLYTDLKEQQAKIASDNVKNLIAAISLPEEVVDELLEYAFRTQNYKILTTVESGKEVQVMRIEKGSSVTDIPMEIVNARSNRKHT